MNPDRALARRVAARFAFKYVPKEKKKAKVDRLTKVIREKTGIGRGTAEDIADAIVRNRDVERLARQKSWPVEDGTIEGPKGQLTFQAVRDQVNKQAASGVYDIRKPTWDVQQAAKEMDRFEFIAYFVARQTRKKAGRQLTDGQWVKNTPKGWVILQSEMSNLPLYPPTRDLNKLYEAMRRGPLNFYVRDAEGLRSDILTEP